MVTTGIIKSIEIDSETNIQYYSVEIPIFSTPNENNKDNYTIKSYCSSTPGFYNQYNIDDKVYVCFVNNELGMPLIIGKINEPIPYRNGEVDVGKATSLAILDELYVARKVKLPTNTEIDGVNLKELKESILSTESSFEKVKELYRIIEYLHPGAIEEYEEASSNLVDVGKVDFMII